MPSIKKNFTYQTIYQVLATALPLLTSPYISRVLGADGLGVYSYTYSIANYFMLFAMLGFANYGTRSIAVVRDDPELKSKKFWEIYSLQFSIAVLMTLIYIVSILINDGEYKTISLIQSMWVISCLFDISWFFSGLEDFKSVVIRNIMVKILTLVLIFLLVRKESDVWIYTAIMAGSTLFAQLWMFSKLRREVVFKRVKFREVIQHFRPCFILFIPILATSVYHIMDKTMLGLISTTTQSGYYYNSDKIVNIPIGFITGIGPVMIPRMSKFAAENKIDQCKIMIQKTFSLVMCAGSAMVFGIVAVAKEFIPIFFGSGFDECIEITSVLVFVIFFKSWSTIARSEYLIPMKQENKYIGSVVMGAIINLAVNIIMIPRIGALGAAVGTLVAEAISSLFQLLIIQKDIPVFKYILQSSWYVVIGCIMVVIVRLVAMINVSNVVKLILEIFVGAAFYCIVCLIVWIVTKDDLFLPIIKNTLHVKDKKN